MSARKCKVEKSGSASARHQQIVECGKHISAWLPHEAAPPSTAQHNCTFYAADTERILQIWWGAQSASSSSPFSRKRPSSHSALCLWALRLLPRRLSASLGTQALQNAHRAGESERVGRRRGGLKCFSRWFNISDRGAINRSAPLALGLESFTKHPLFHNSMLRPSQLLQMTMPWHTQYPSSPRCIYMSLLKAATLLSFHSALCLYIFGCREWKLHLFPRQAFSCCISETWARALGLGLDQEQQVACGMASPHKQLWECQPEEKYAPVRLGNNSAYSALKVFLKWRTDCSTYRGRQLREGVWGRRSRADYLACSEARYETSSYGFISKQTFFFSSLFHTPKGRKPNFYFFRQAELFSCQLHHYWQISTFDSRCQYLAKASDKQEGN